jgi:hypothetical protein
MRSAFILPSISWPVMNISPKEWLVCSMTWSPTQAAHALHDDWRSQDGEGEELMRHRWECRRRMNGSDSTAAFLVAVTMTTAHVRQQG